MSASDDNSLSSDQDTNQFLVQTEIEPQISYTIIRDFINRANWNSHNQKILTKHIILYNYLFIISTAVPTQQIFSLESQNPNLPFPFSSQVTNKSFVEVIHKNIIFFLLLLCVLLQREEFLFCTFVLFPLPRKRRRKKEEEEKIRRRRRRRVFQFYL